METFLIPDLHGKPASLRALLEAASIIDSNGERFPVDADYPYQVVSIGDLLNGTMKDQEGDRESLLMSTDWIDKLIIGNHEIEYIYPNMNMSFNGYYPAPDIISQYRSLFFQGKVIPAMLLGETLVTHAGVNCYFNFLSAQEAFAAINDVWTRLPDLSFEVEESFHFEYKRQPVEMPKETLISAVAKDRGGSYPFAGILWSDWSEAKNINFNQIVGHTPIEEGPVLHEYKQAGVFTLNIDAGGKKGLPPVGVWVDDHGIVTSYVAVSGDELDASTSFR